MRLSINFSELIRLSKIIVTSVNGQIVNVSFGGDFMEFVGISYIMATIFIKKEHFFVWRQIKKNVVTISVCPDDNRHNLFVRSATLDDVKKKKKKRFLFSSIGEKASRMSADQKQLMGWEQKSRGENVFIERQPSNTRVAMAMASVCERIFRGYFFLFGPSILFWSVLCRFPSPLLERPANFSPGSGPLMITRIWVGSRLGHRPAPFVVVFAELKIVRPSNSRPSALSTFPSNSFRCLT